MSTLLIIDNILGIKPVQYLLLLVSVSFVLLSVFLGIRVKYLSTQLEISKGQTATYAAHLKIQNESILQMNQEQQAQQQQMSDAASKADWIKKDAEAWRKKALGTPLTGTCDQMVDQVIEAVKK